MLRKLAIMGAALVLGGGASVGVAACGEKRGSLKIEGGSGTSETGTAGTETSKTTTSP